MTRALIAYFFLTSLLVSQEVKPVLSVPNFDIREEAGPQQNDTLRQIFTPGSVLTAKSGADAETIAREFLRTSVKIPSEGLRLTQHARFEVGSTLRFDQFVDGVRVFDGSAVVSIDGDGQVLHASIGRLLAGGMRETVPKFSAWQGVQAAMAVAGISPALSSPTGAREEGNRTEFRNPLGQRNSNISVELVLFLITPARAVPAYHVYLEVDATRWYEIVVDAVNGRLLYRHNLYVQAAQGRVWKESPLEGDRSLLTFPAGWLPSGVTVTTGNNTDSFLDTNGDDKPDSNNSGGLQGGRASSATQNFDFTAETAGAHPALYPATAVTNMFYLVNIAHDYYYGLGFTESAGNFQTDNLGQGGKGGDAVLAHAQDSALLNNSAFATPPEGTAPHLRLGLFNLSGPAVTGDRDAALSGQVVMHEYGHGVSNRMIGKGTSTDCLIGRQSGALSEGWSDYFSISYYNNPIEAAYVAGDLVKGLRRQSYEGYTLTYSDLGNQKYEVHNDGEIWAAALWDIRKSLGQSLTDKLVFQGFRFTPCRPSMVDARDAILTADQSVNNSAARTTLWTIFARHGLGYSAAGTDGSAALGTVYTSATDLPPDLQPAVKHFTVKSQPGTSVVSAAYSYQIATTATAGTTLTYTLNEGPTGLAVNSSGLVTWSATFFNARVKITISDGQGATIVHGFEIANNTVLTPGTVITVAGSKNTAGVAHVTVPAGTLILQVKLTGGTGDADLYLEDPDGIPFGTCVNDGIDELISVPLPKAGSWYIEVDGYSSYVNASLLATFPVPKVLAAPSTTAIAGVFPSETYYKVIVPANAAALFISTTGSVGGDDLELLVRRGQPVTCMVNEAFVYLYPWCKYDYISAHYKNANESLVIPSPPAGDYYIDIVGSASYNGETLNVNLTFNPALAVSASSLTFAAVVGSTPPAAQALNISNANGGSITWSATAASETGSWLKITPASGTAAGTLTVSADITGLAAGTYKGSITISAPNLGASPQTIPVTLTITPSPKLTVSPATLTFTAVPAVAPPDQTLTIANASGAAFSWTAAAATETGSWLKISSTSGSGSASATLTVSIAVTGLATGSYKGTITVTAPSLPSSPIVVAVTLAVSGPAISANGIVDAAGFGGSLSRGSIGAVFGAGFADAIDQAPSVPLPTTLQGIRVTVGGFDAPLYFVSSGQINFQAPFELPLTGTANVVVSKGGVASAAVPITLKDYAPGIFTYPAASGVLPVITKVDGSLITPANPAKAGDVLVVYATGLGDILTSQKTGDYTTASPLPYARATATATLGGVTIPVDYAGLTPGLVGLAQFNLTIPANTGLTGVQTFSIKIGNSTTNTVNLSVSN